nr:hypothetical protein CFP56_12896 [Quercus suber]
MDEEKSCRCSVVFAFPSSIKSFPFDLLPGPGRCGPSRLAKCKVKEREEQGYAGKCKLRGGEEKGAQGGDVEAKERMRLVRASQTKQAFFVILIDRGASEVALRDLGTDKQASNLPRQDSHWHSINGIYDVHAAGYRVRRCSARLREVTGGAIDETRWEGEGI